MGYKKIALACAALSLAAAPTLASDDQTIETFDARAVGLDQVDIYNPAFLFHTALNGGAVALGTPDNPAHSGTNVYGGTSISLMTEDEDQFAWPGIGAWVSGADTIWLQAYEYDADTGMESALTPVALAGGGTDFYLSIGSFESPHLITRANLYSDSYFTIDDLTLGIEGIGPGIPEPASWAMAIGGLAMVGGTLRVRRRLRESALAAI